MDTKEPGRPLPHLDEPDTREFWQATTAHQFRFQVCQNCDAIAWYPKYVCSACTDGELKWHTAQGEGYIYSFSVVRQSYHPFFRNLVPYAVAWVELDEGPRFLTNVIGVEDPTELVVGQRVRISWEDHPEVSLPLVTPI